MTLPIQIIINMCHHDLTKEEIKPAPKLELNQPKIKFNYDAKPYQRRNKGQVNYNKGYYCNMNQTNTRSFNGASNKSYKGKK